MASRDVIVLATLTPVLLPEPLASWLHHATGSGPTVFQRGAPRWRVR